MNRETVHRIVELVRQAQELARQNGVANLLQPGLVKELIIADILGHEVISSKRDADAHASGNPSVKYEYLSCKEKGSGQFDRMFKSPPEKRAESLRRITRNTHVYFAVFFAKDQLRVKEIIELDPDVVRAEVERQLDRSRNEISHTSHSVTWAKANGVSVYADPGDEILD